MNLRKALIAATLGGAIGLPFAANAITINGITFQEGSIFELGELWEAERLSTCAATGGNCNGFIDQEGEELVGIGVITSIRGPGGGDPLWVSGDNGKQLTIYFDSFFAESVTSTYNPTTEVGSAEILFSGGRVQL
mgnify:CR=1 FL=1